MGMTRKNIPNTRNRNTKLGEYSLGLIITDMVGDFIHEYQRDGKDMRLIRE
jgi:hypothetical protein